MATNLPFPYIPSRSTAVYTQGFDPSIFRTDTSSKLWNFLDALIGTTGAGSLINQVFFTNLGAAIETCYFHELDYIVGNINFLSRTTAESYPYDPASDQLTSDQWDEVRVKDAWFRARIKDFFEACQLGGTPEGIRKAVSAAIGTDCTIQETWRYIDNFGLAEFLGRTESTNHYAVTNLKTGFEVMFSGDNALSAANSFKASQSPSTDWERRVIRPRNEVVIRPHKQSVSPVEMRLLRQLLNRMLPMETVITVSTEGLGVSTPVKISAAAADASYYEVVKQVIPSPLVGQMPDPEFLPIDLLPGEAWLLQNKIPPWNLTGTISISGRTVTGSGTAFLTELAGHAGSTLRYPSGAGLVSLGSGPYIKFGSDYRKVARVMSNTEARLVSPFPTDVSASTSLMATMEPPPRGLFSKSLESSKPTSNKREAPYAAFMQTSQYGYYYLFGGSDSPIDSVTYGTLESDGTIKAEQNYRIYQQNSAYTEWISYEKADSPDNYPGGKFGQHPGYKPALNPDGTPYSFPYDSQSQFVTEITEKITAMGGIATPDHYRLPIQKNQTIVYSYYPEYAVSNFPPTKESTVSASITRKRPRTTGNNLGDISNLVR